LTVVIFTATTKWSSIPVSNLFYSLIFQIMGWIYQYFYMVSCTRQLVAQREPMRVTPPDPDTTEMRRLIYTEFSVVMPLILVATMMPAANGVDAWRVQTVLFGSWVFFTLMGLHLFYRKSLDCADVQEHGFGAQVCGVDGLAYLTYAIVLSFIMTLNAMGGNTWHNPEYATYAVIASRQSARIIVLTACLLLLETLIKSIITRVKHSRLTSETYNQVGERVQDYRDSIKENSGGLLPSFIANVVVIAVGAFLVKIVAFAGLVNVNALSIVAPL
jgi:hypothetical protein